MVGRLWIKVGESPWRRAVQNALEPISIGLMCSGVWSVAKAAIDGPVSAGLAVITLGVILCSRLNPAYMILGAGAIGAYLMHLTGLS